jgi:pimeloyl-ACP methyl ester carboxylesterase
MNGFRFAEDIQSVMKCVQKPLLLYGHSAGAAAAVVATHRNPDIVKLLFLEGCYACTTEGLRSLYRSKSRWVGPIFAPAVVFFMDMLYGFSLNTLSPARLAPDLEMPALIIHGERDQSFPLHHAVKLKDAFPPGQAELFVARDSDHSSSSLDPRFPEALRSFVERRLTW